MLENIKQILLQINKEKEKNRKFEKVSHGTFYGAVKKMTGDKFSDQEIKKIHNSLIFPKRGTSKSAGYDFYIPYSFTLKPNETIVIPTGFKASMNDDEILKIYVRSSTGFKFNVRLKNQVGIIDADYYNNPSNEGHIMIAFHNHGDKDWVNFGVEQNEMEVSRGAQGIFVNYLKAADDGVLKKDRSGGIGSTN